MRYVLTMVGLFGACDPEFGAVDPVERTCSDYCEKRATCDDETNLDTCVSDCVEQAGNCQADEQEQALDELETCTEESCDDIGLCTIGASLECYFGI